MKRLFNPKFRKKSGNNLELQSQGIPGKPLPIATPSKIPYAVKRLIIFFDLRIAFSAKGVPVRNRSRGAFAGFCTVLALLFHFLLGCVTGAEKAEEKSEAKMSAEERKAFNDLKAEQEIGRNMAGRLLAHYGVVENDALVGYVNQVGNYVASYGEFPDRRYMFNILNSDSVNAFACPGGYILITIGALRLAKNEAELAMVLGHESAHVGHKHMFNTLKNMESGDFDSLAKKNGGQTEEALAGRKRPEPDRDDEAGATLARYLGGV